MFQVRFHGRGGQGVVTAAELLSVAAFLEGKYAQAFPSFGSERMGAPVVSFCRIDDRDIRLREPVTEPDAIVVQDATLLRAVPVFEGCKRKGYIVLNSTDTVDELFSTSSLRDVPAGHVVCLAASELAREHVGRSLPNVPLLGALAALTKVVRIESLAAALRDRFPSAVAERNIAAARAGHDAVAATV